MAGTSIDWRKTVSKKMPTRITSASCWFITVEEKRRPEKAAAMMRPATPITVPLCSRPETMAWALDNPAERAERMPVMRNTS
eukprot:scaffold92088_cov31-Tisochrysis_lutea.AAC.2